MKLRSCLFRDSTYFACNSRTRLNTSRHWIILILSSRSTSDRSGKDCCGQWFNGPPLRFLVILVALGGVACELAFISFGESMKLTFSRSLLGTLGGATLGSIALAGSPTSHLTAGLLMTGKGLTFLFCEKLLKTFVEQCKKRTKRKLFFVRLPFHDS